VAPRAGCCDVPEIDGGGGKGRFGNRVRPVAVRAAGGLDPHHPLPPDHVPALCVHGRLLGVAAGAIDRLEFRLVRQISDILVAVGAGEVLVNRPLILCCVDVEAHPGEGGGMPPDLFRAARGYVRRLLLVRPGKDIRIPVAVEAVGVFHGPGRGRRNRKQDRHCREQENDAGPFPTWGKHHRYLPLYHQ
jgi:hypothetical protein